MRTLIFALFAIGCGYAHDLPGEADTNLPTTSKADSASDITAKLNRVLTVNNRKYPLYVPTRHLNEPDAALPLYIELHGLASSGNQIENYFKMLPLAEHHNFYLARPDGHGFPLGWNATNGCCKGEGGDDVDYIRAIIDQVSTLFPVDKKQIFIIGHSNGAFMAHRAACELSDRIAGIVSVSGQVWSDTAKCNPTSPVSILEFADRDDGIIGYYGGTFRDYPSSPRTAQIWAQKNGCTGMPVYATDDSDKKYPLPDETVTQIPADRLVLGQTGDLRDYTGCPAGVDVALYSFPHGGHQPDLDPFASEWFYSFLGNHPKP